MMHLLEIPIAKPSPATKTKGFMAMHAQHVLLVSQMQLVMMPRQVILFATPSCAPKISGFRAMRARHVLLVRPTQLATTHLELTPHARQPPPRPLPPANPQTMGQ